MAESNLDVDVDELFLEIKDNSQGDKFASLAVDTINVARRIKDIKKNLDSGTYKSEKIEELYRLELMALDLRSQTNLMEMNKLVAKGDSLSLALSLSKSYKVVK
jgi:hypothetical protein